MNIFQGGDLVKVQNKINNFLDPLTFSGIELFEYTKNNY